MATQGIAMNTVCTVVAFPATLTACASVPTSHCCDWGEWAGDSSAWPTTPSSFWDEADMMDQWGYPIHPNRTCMNVSFVAWLEGREPLGKPSPWDVECYSDQEDWHYSTKVW